jgi:hypothetical protein
VDAALSPIKLTAWAYDRYHLDQRYYRVFFHDARTIGLVPTAAFDRGVRDQRRRAVRDRGRVDVEVTGGLEPGALVILHPTDRIGDGVAVAPR